jgi:hypothetical protein
MGDPAGHLTPCSHALHPLELGKVIEKKDHADALEIFAMKNRGLTQHRQPLPV